MFEGDKQNRTEIEPPPPPSLLSVAHADFIRTLDADFPSTVPTVVRTAHKLGLRSSQAAFQELASAASSSSTSSTSSPPSSTAATRETNCPLCGLPAQPRADEWRKAITISDLQAVLAADPRGATASTSTTTLGRVGKGTGARAAGEEQFVKRREPYQPSQAHLLVKPGTGGDGDGDEAATTTTTTTVVKEEVQEENAVAVPSSSSLPSTPSPAAAVDETDSLARYLCYGCLLVLSEPASASAQRANKNKTKIQNGPAAAAAAVDVFLPGYVSEAVQRRREREEKEGRRGVVGTREVRGEEGMRREVERYLLD